MDLWLLTRVSRQVIAPQQNRLLGKASTLRVFEEIRLLNGGISPIPIGLPIVKTDHLIVGKEILLRLAKRAALLPAR